MVTHGTPGFLIRLSFLLFFLACIAATSRGVMAQEPEGPEIEIMTAVLGTGRGSGKCAQEIQGIIENREAITVITSAGLKIRNPSGRFRDVLRITYLIDGEPVFGEDGKPAVLTLSNGARVNIYKAILEHAAANRANQGKEAEDEGVEDMAEATPGHVAPPEPPAESKIDETRPASQDAAAVRVEQDVVIPLAGIIARVRTGGNGRFLVMHLREKGILVIVDLVRKELVKEIPVTDDVVFAASREKLLIALPTGNQLQRWDLSTLAREKSANLDRESPPVLAVMGAGGDGPLAMWGDGDVQFWDIEQMKPITVQGEVLNGASRHGYDMMASANGKTFCGWVEGVSGQPFNVMRLEGQSFRISQTERHSMNHRWGAPIADGSKLLGFGGRAYTWDLTPVSIQDSRDSEFHPTEDARFFLKAQRRNDADLQVTLCTTSDFTPICTLPEFKSVGSEASRRMGGEAPVRYLPAENIVACLTNIEGGGRVVIRDFDLTRTLAESGKDYLFVISKPAGTATVGSTFEYQMELLTNAENVKYSLESAPQGMEIGNDGKIMWAIKSRPENGLASVIVSVTAPNGNNVVQAFDLIVSYSNAPVSKDGMVASPGNNALLLVRDDSDNKYDQVVARLPGKFDAMRTGGAGRYLIFHIHEKGVLAVFDLKKKAVVTEIPAPEGSSFAASREKLLVANPQINQLERWDLTKLNREKVVELDRTKPPTLAVMGASGDGPLALLCSEEIQLWDIEKMEPVAVRGQLPKFSDYVKHEMSVSADGQTFCWWSTNFTQPFKVLRITGESVSILETPDHHDYNGRWAMPSPDGSMLLRYGAKAYRRDLQPITSVTFTIFPTTDPRFVIAIDRQDEQYTQMTICTAADLKPVCTLQDLDSVSSDSVGTFHGRLGSEPRLRYLHDEKMVVCIPDGNDRVVMRNFDLKSSLDEKAEDYLFVISKPAPVVYVGQPFSYKLQSISGADGVHYKLDSGPTGMTVSPNGLVGWTPDSRPVGGVANVVIEVENSAGTKFIHGFEIAIERNPQGELAGGPDDNDPRHKTGQNAGFVVVDDVRLELPAPASCITPGLNGRMIVLAGDQLAVLKPDGWSVESSATLDKAYFRIGERDDYYVALSEEPKGVYVLDKRSFKVIKSFPLEVIEFCDLVLHPHLPISYVAAKRKHEVPRYGFILFDERTGTGKEDPDWIGNWLAIDPSGRFMLGAYSDTYVSGSRLLMNPDRWHVVPEYGSLDWLIRYSLDRDGFPKDPQVKEDAGGDGEGIRMSPDGKRVCFLSHTGYPQSPNKLAAWDSSDFSKIPLSYDTKDKATTLELAFHPNLPIAASPGSGSAVFFDSVTGEIQTDRLRNSEQILDGLKVDRIFFSPDGTNLIFCANVNGINYLHKLPLHLTPEEKKLNSAGQKGSLAAPRKKAEPVATVPLTEFDALKGGMGTKMSTADIAKLYMDSVVLVESGDATGTGFVVGANGYLLTCAHCVPDPESIFLSYRNSGGTAKRINGTLVWMDDEVDLALIKVDVPKPLTPVRLAVGHAIDTGIPVCVIGNPGVGDERLDYTMTEGIISSADREFDGFPYLQSTAAVNPGSSGGPMFNDQGMVIGIVVLKARIEGAGFAIPANEIGKFLMKHLDQQPEAMAIERSWYDSTGKGPLEGTFHGKSNNAVEIRRTSDGKVFKLPIERLSEPDRFFIKLMPRSNR
jgi:S1-C subfamily serine protease